MRGLGPVRLPQKLFKDAFEELEPHIAPDGRVLKRYRLVRFGGVRLENGPIATEQRTDVLFPLGKIKLQPLEMPPTSGIFFMDYTYGKKT